MNPLTVIDMIRGIVGDTAFILGSIVGGILVLAVALLGLGWSYRALQRHVTGSPFGGNDLAAIELNLSRNNKRYAAQIMNDEIIERGDKVPTISSWQS